MKQISLYLLKLRRQFIYITPAALTYLNHNPTLCPCHTASSPMILVSKLPPGNAKDKLQSLQVAGCVKFKWKCKSLACLKFVYV